MQEQMRVLMETTSAKGKKKSKEKKKKVELEGGGSLLPPGINQGATPSAGAVGAVVKPKGAKKKAGGVGETPPGPTNKKQKTGTRKKNSLTAGPGGAVAGSSLLFACVANCFVLYLVSYYNFLLFVAL